MKIPVLLFIAIIVSSGVYAANSRMHIQSLRSPYSVSAGDPFVVSVGLRQTSGIRMRDVSTRAYLMDTGEIAYADSLSSLKTNTQFVNAIFDTPDDLTPGEYLVKVTTSVKTKSHDNAQKSQRASKYRYITVE